MKVILYMAMTANGYIAKENDDTSWVSKEEWDSYSKMVQKAGCLIVGRRTYHILTSQQESKELGKVKFVVVTNKDFKTHSPNHVIAKSPREALEILKEYEVVIVAGGGMLNASFMEENLVDEIYIDVEPVIFGKGIKLFGDGDFHKNLKLLDVKKISDNEVQLHYKVEK